MGDSGSQPRGVVTPIKFPKFSKNQLLPADAASPKLLAASPSCFQLLLSLSSNFQLDIRRKKSHRELSSAGYAGYRPLRAAAAETEETF